MDQLQLSVTMRQRQLKGDNKRLRRDGKIPAVIYGGKGEAKSVTVDNHEIELILRGAYTKPGDIFQLSIDGQSTEPAILRDVQRHPVNEKLIHLDFLRIDMAEELEIEVPVHVVGSDPIGVREGGILEHVNRTIHVRCKPMDMPHALDADLSDLGINETFTVEQLSVPAGVQVLNEPDTPLFAIVAPAAAIVEEEAAEEEALEPEVIGEKKEEEEGAEE